MEEPKVSKSSERRKRLDPSVLNTAILDEIAERLFQIQKHFEEETPQGIVEPLPLLTVTTTPSVVEPPHEGKYWFSVSVVNQGPQDCYVVVNTGKSSETPHLCDSGETYEVRFSKPLIYDLRLWTDTGVATVKIKGTR